MLSLRELPVGRPPYAVYFQGGLTWQHAKLGVLMSLQKLADAGLAKLAE